MLKSTLGSKYFLTSPHIGCSNLKKHPQEVTSSHRVRRLGQQAFYAKGTFSCKKAKSYVFYMPGAERGGSFSTTTKARQKQRRRISGKGFPPLSRREEPLPGLACMGVGRWIPSLLLVLGPFPPPTPVSVAGFSPPMVVLAPIKLLSSFLRAGRTSGCTDKWMKLWFALQARD